MTTKKEQDALDAAAAEKEDARQEAKQRAEDARLANEKAAREGHSTPVDDPRSERWQGSDTVPKGTAWPGTGAWPGGPGVVGGDPNAAPGTVRDGGEWHAGTGPVDAAGVSVPVSVFAGTPVVVGTPAPTVPTIAAPLVLPLRHAVIDARGALDLLTTPGHGGALSVQQAKDLLVVVDTYLAHGPGRISVPPSLTERTSGGRFGAHGQILHPATTDVTVPLPVSELPPADRVSATDPRTNQQIIDAEKAADKTSADARASKAASDKALADADEHPARRGHR